MRDPNPCDERRAPAAVLALTLALALALCSGCSGPAAPPPAGPLIPQTEDARGRGVSMTLPLLGGGQIAVERHRGAPLLITLFTTWSLRCQAEAKIFNQIHAGHAGQGLRMLGIVLDINTRPELMQTYVEFVKYSFDVALARPDDLDLVGGLGPTRQVPRTVLLDRRGVKVLDQVGQTDFPALKRRLVQLLASKPRPR